MLFLAYRQWSRGTSHCSFALSKNKCMKTKQTIAVIGATGNMGSAISKSLAKGNYRLLLCSDDKGKVQTIMNDIRNSHPAADVETVDCSEQASWEADIVIAAVPYQAEKEVAEK